MHSVSNGAATQSDPTLISGDFAGLSATFSPEGFLIPVPQHLVPEALLEWGQAPSCLEVIVSEQILADERTIERQTVTVYPAVGCGVDNLDTSKVIECIRWDSKASSDAAIAMDYEISDKKVRTETIFALPNNHRLRLILDLINQQVQSPIRVNLERRTSTTSTRGTISDGGGLDGRTVSRLLGDELNSGTQFSDEVVEQVNDGTIRLPRGISFALNGDSLTIRHENQSIMRSYRKDGSVAIDIQRKFSV